MLYLCIVLFLLAVISFIIGNIFKSYDWDTWQSKWSEYPIMIAVAFLILSFIFTIGSIGGYFSDLKSIRDTNTTKITISESRKNNSSDLERAALIQTIINKNEKIAEMKRDNKNWFFESVTPDEVDNLEFLK